MAAMDVLPLCDSSLCYMSSDELMLKELERRDGIYSFIFHELEAPKAPPPLPLPPPSPSPAATPITLDSPETPYPPETPYTPATTSGPDTPSSHDDYNETLAAEAAVSAGIASAEARSRKFAAELFALEMKPGTTTTTMTTTTTTRQEFQFLGEADAASRDSSLFISPSMTMSLPPPSPCSPCPSVNKILPTVDYLRMWQPPSPFVYQQHPQLFAYMDNCDFRVRVAAPRFSHDSAPLVRNRQHFLKEMPAYTCYQTATAAGDHYIKQEQPSLPPDLRELFPHDPDVHAPFRTHPIPSVAVPKKARMLTLLM